MIAWVELHIWIHFSEWSFNPSLNFKRAEEFITYLIFQKFIIQHSLHYGRFKVIITVKMIIWKYWSGTNGTVPKITLQYIVPVHVDTFSMVCYMTNNQFNMATKILYFLVAYITSIQFRHMMLLLRQQHFNIIPTRLVSYAWLIYDCHFTQRSGHWDYLLLLQILNYIVSLSIGIHLSWPLFPNT